MDGCLLSDFAVIPSRPLFYTLHVGFQGLPSHIHKPLLGLGFLSYQRFFLWLLRFTFSHNIGLLHPHLKSSDILELFVPICSYNSYAVHSNSMQLFHIAGSPLKGFPHSPLVRFSRTPSPTPTHPQSQRTPLSYKAKLHL